MRTITHREVERAAAVTAIQIRQRFGDCPYVYPIPRGGIPAAYAVQRFLPNMIILDNPDNAICFIDDLLDSGATMARYMEAYPERPFFSLFNKADFADWLVFPWEGSEDKSADDIPVRLLQFIGEDPQRGGLLETPKRFLKAWKHWTSGYGQDPASVLKVFEDGAEKCDEMVLVSNIPVHSKCEHHCADIWGLAHVAYIPNGKIVGLSKIARLVDIFARRLQVQERLTSNIADALNDNLSPLGVGVVLQCRHMCMESRGIATRGTITTTSAMRGAMKDKPEARAEFLRLIEGARNGVQI